MTDGLIILDKPGSMSSARAVAAVKHRLGRSTKVGHAGTLDPFATGVLVLLIGRATRDCETIMSWPKTYEATIKLGATTATDDIESPEVPFAGGAHAPQLDQIVQTLLSFTGSIEQRPPTYSAIKIAGRRACDRVRAGDRDIELKPRVVRVHSIDVLSYDWPLLNVRIDCGRGTYIRSIARDLGQALNVGGYLTALRRTRVGACTIERAVRLAELNAQNVWSHVVAIPA